MFQGLRCQHEETLSDQRWYNLLINKDDNKWIETHQLYLNAGAPKVT